MTLLVRIQVQYSLENRSMFLFGGYFFVYAAHFLRLYYEAIGLSSPPSNRAKHLLIHRIQSHTNPKRRKVFLKQAGQKSSKEELPKQRKASKRAVKYWLKVQTHVWEQDAGSASLSTQPIFLLFINFLIKMLYFTSYGLLLLVRPRI